MLGNIRKLFVHKQESLLVVSVRYSKQEDLLHKCNFSTQVSVDGQQEEMPVQFDNTVIRRMGPVVRIDNHLGVSVVCNWKRDICTLHMSGWYVQHDVTLNTYRLHFLMKLLLWSICE